MQLAFSVRPEMAERFDVLVEEFGLSKVALFEVALEALTQMPDKTAVAKQREVNRLTRRYERQVEELLAG